MMKSEQKIFCRLMKEEDLEMVMNWRMMPEITRFMYTDPKITLDRQIIWFNTLKECKGNFLWIIEVDDIPAGVMTITDIDYKNKRCSPIFYIAEIDKRSLEGALRIEWSMFEFIFDKLNMNKFNSEVFSFNKGVIRLHQMCGCSIEGVLKDHIFKNDEFYDVTLLGLTKREWENKKQKFKYLPIGFEVI
ncbi:MAG: UDP-4-amino-4,6-dideoxy-N-acetyl-beta-L-altrosamine N-acetyltransferase [Clostridium sp.]